MGDRCCLPQNIYTLNRPLGTWSNSIKRHSLIRAGPRSSYPATVGLNRKSAQGTLMSVIPSRHLLMKIICSRPNFASWNALWVAHLQAPGGFKKCFAWKTCGRASPVGWLQRWSRVSEHLINISYISGSSNCDNFLPFHPKNQPKGRHFALLEDKVYIYIYICLYMHIYNIVYQVLLILRICVWPSILRDLWNSRQSNIVLNLAP